MSTILFEDLKEDYRKVINNPGSMFRTTLKELEKATDGKVNIVDFNNPFIYLLECSLAQTAAAVTHYHDALAKSYPSLSTTPDALYRHMSNEDYLDRFAIPCEGDFLTTIQYDTFINNSVISEDGMYRYAIFPKDTSVTIGNETYCFTFTIEVRVYTNNTVKVIRTKEDGEITVIEHIITKDDADVKHINYLLSLTQVHRKYIEDTTTRSVVWRKSVEIDGQFRQVIAHWWNEEDEVWSKFNVTHSEDVYSTTSPTIVVSVDTDDIVNLHIPPIFTIRMSTGVRIKITIETTSGYIDRSYANSEYGAFTYSLEDHLNELTPANHAWDNISFRIVTTKRFIGGRDGLSFPELRERMLQNNIGTPNIPITPNNLRYKLEDNGFLEILYENISTGRLYIGTSDVPQPTGLTWLTEVPLAVPQLTSNLEMINRYSTVNAKEQRSIIKPNSLFMMTDNSIRFLSEDELSHIKSLEPMELKSFMVLNKYVFTPFTWVIDYGINNDSLLHVRPYVLDSPELTYDNFRYHNNSSELIMYPGDIQIDHDVDQGYTITASVKEDPSQAALTPADVYGQLSMVSSTTGDRTWIDHSEVVQVDGVFYIQFKIDTDFDIDVDHNIEINDVIDGVNRTTNTSIPLDVKFDLLIGTTIVPADYQASIIDSITHLEAPEQIRKPNTWVELYIKLGTYLEYLWRDSRPLPDSVTYQTYSTDQFDTYPNNIMDYGEVEYDDKGIAKPNIPFTVDGDCNLIYKDVHVAGTLIRDDDDNPVILHYKGDVILDEDGNGVPSEIIDRRFLLDIVCIDALLYFTTDEASRSHLRDTIEYLKQRSTNHMEVIRNDLLEHTECLYKPMSSLGMMVGTSGKSTAYINKEQYITVSIKASGTIYTNLEARDLLRTNTIVTINELFKRKTITSSRTIAALKEVYGDVVISFTVDGLLDDKYDTISVKDVSDRLCIAKELVLTDDNELSLSEAITVVFVNHDEK